MGIDSKDALAPLARSLALALVLLLSSCGGNDCEDDLESRFTVRNDTEDAVNLSVDDGMEVQTATLLPGEQTRFVVAAAVEPADPMDPLDSVSLEATVCTPAGAACTDVGPTTGTTLVALDGCTEGALVRVSALSAVP